MTDITSSPTLPTDTEQALPPMSELAQIMAMLHKLDTRQEELASKVSAPIYLICRYLGSIQADCPACRTYHVLTLLTRSKPSRVPSTSVSLPTPHSTRLLSVRSHRRRRPSASITSLAAVRLPALTPTRLGRARPRLPHSACRLARVWVV
jgi:hypothetical protein